MTIISRLITTVIIRIYSTILLCADLSRPAAALTADSPWSEPATFSGSSVGYSTQVIAEVDGDPSDGKEIVAASTNGTLAAFHADGTLLWQVKAPASGCSTQSEIHSRPVVGDLYGTGTPYVAVGYGGFSRVCDGGIMVIKGDTGTVAWTFSTKAF